MNTTSRTHRPSFSDVSAMATAKQIALALRIDPNQPGTIRLANALAQALQRSGRDVAPVRVRARRGGG